MEFSERERERERLSCLKEKNKLWVELNGAYTSKIKKSWEFCGNWLLDPWGEVMPSMNGEVGQNWGTQVWRGKKR